MKVSKGRIMYKMDYKMKNGNLKSFYMSQKNARKHYSNSLNDFYETIIKLNKKIEIKN